MSECPKSECPLSANHGVDKACNHDFSGQRRFLETRPLPETFQLKQTNKRAHEEKLGGFMILGILKLHFNEKFTHRSP